MEDLHAVLKELQSSLQSLLKKYNSLKKENEHLKKVNAEFNKLLAEKNNLIKASEEKLTVHNVGILYNLEEKELLQLKINAYLKDIDMC